MRAHHPPLAELCTVLLPAARLLPCTRCPARWLRGRAADFPSLSAGKLSLVFLIPKQPRHKPPPGCSWMGRASSLHVGELLEDFAEREKAFPSLCSASSALATEPGPPFSPTSLPAAPALAPRWGLTGSKPHSPRVGGEQQSTERYRSSPKEAPRAAGSGAGDSALPDESAASCPSEMFRVRPGGL